MLHLPSVLGLVSSAILFLLFFNSKSVFDDLSLQGCRMSWMSPSYVLQNQFNTSWSPLADRYSLLLYREVGWDPNEIIGTPVLFIPGNAGSSHQVRSIASSATRQFYSSPSAISSEFASRTLKQLDFFAVEFNEDLSAFHGPTLEAQIAYTSRAISYILSLYPANTSIIVLGHSMGGIVATSLLPNPNISGIITMSTPHSLPPARFDSRIDKIYRENKRVLDDDSTPIVSLCGGATDMLIPSESCILPTSGNRDHPFRRTVFTSAMDGVWTGVGHREMVWCHQVRWRVARASLEMTAGTSPMTRARILDTWLRDGQDLRLLEKPASGEAREISKYQVLDEGDHVGLVRPQGSTLRLIPVPTSPSSQMTAVVFGVAGSFSPGLPNSLSSMRVSVVLCTKSMDESRNGSECRALEPSLLKMVPNPEVGKVFPLPEQGVGDWDSATVFEAELPPAELDVKVQRWVGIRIENGEGVGWVYGGISMNDEVVVPVDMLTLIFGVVNITFPATKALRARFLFPNALSNALVVYKYIPMFPGTHDWCSDPLLGRVIMHTSQPMETHYFPLDTASRRILLHTHHSAPYIPSLAPARTPLEFTIYSSGSLGCNMPGFLISVDWPATLGRWASRYPTTLIVWSIGIVAIILYTAWGVGDRGFSIPTVGQSLQWYSCRTFPVLLFASSIVAALPIPSSYYLGTRGEIFLAPVAPGLILIASGLVSISWGMLICLMWILGSLQAVIGARRLRRREAAGVRRSTLASLVLICIFIFLFVPWQVAYLGCWTVHLYYCALSQRRISLLASSPSSGTLAVGRDERLGERTEQVRVKNHEGQRKLLEQTMLDNHRYAMHLLLLMTWLLPLVAPVLVVWVRTLTTAGLTTPFDGDHDFLNVVPFLVLVDFSSWNNGLFLERRKFEKMIPVRWCWVVLAGVAFIIGPRQAYTVFDAAKIAVGVTVVIGIGQRYWTGSAS